MSDAEQPSASVQFIDRCIARTDRPIVGLLLGQLDAFNRISSTFGLAAAKRFCREYIEGLKPLLPAGSSVIRLSDRRFIVLLALDSVGGVLDTADRLTEAERARVQIGGDSFVVDLTIGVAIYPTHADDGNSLIRRAELALNDARAGEVAMAVYTPDATRRLTALWKLESDFQQAVERGELEVHYQPKMALAGGRVCGVEALARWKTSSGAYVPPQQFVPLAERSGSIVPMTWLIFDRIAARVDAWTAHRPMSVAVNVSPQVLQHAEFFARLGELQRVADRAQIGLTVELTEESLVAGDAASVAMLERVRRLGVGLSIDDFGKGYSSLSYLKEIPATEVKIDKRFIATAGTDEKDRQIVRVIVELARAFEMKVVAEGVDSPRSLRAVARLGCDLAQGFFIARPMPAELVSDWLRRADSEAARFETALRQRPIFGIQAAAAHARRAGDIDLPASGTPSG